MQTRPSVRGLCTAAAFFVLTGCHRTDAAPPADPARPGESSGAADAARTQGTAAPNVERVTLRTSDGWTLAGELRAAPGEPGPAVVLVHQLASNRSEWGPLIARLQPAHGARITTLAFDLRGHGESTAGPEGATTWQSFGTDTQRWGGVVRDVEAAVGFLRSRPRPPTALVLVGSSLGSSAALRYAADDSAAVGVVLLSPGVAYRGLDTLEPMTALASSGRAALLVTAEGDARAAEAVAQLVQRAEGRAQVSSLILSGTAAHGVAMGAPGAQPELWQRVNDWIRSTLGAQP